MTRPSSLNFGRLCLWAALAISPTAARAGGGPENVFLVVNARGAKSMEVANHYIELRKIPASNVFYVNTPPNWHAMPGADFRDKILRPTLAEIQRRGLRPQIDQIAYSCEFPWQIDFTARFSGVPLSNMNRPRVSLTSATYFYQLVEKADAGLTQLNSNYYYSSRVPTVTQAFRGSYQWAQGAERVQTAGSQYLLASSLGFTQPDCSTVPEILTYLKRAAAADGTQPRGTFYFMDNPDIRSQTRKPAYAAAVAQLKALGHHAEIARGVVPVGKKDIAGLTTGSAIVRLGSTDCGLLPGALVDNLTSLGGALWPITKPNPQTRVSEYLRLGAAGASGTVVEPFAVAAKFPAPTLHVHYARGCSMAEAFYQSVEGPFQLLIVGDPLCQPWAKFPVVSVEGLKENDVLSGKIDLKPSAKVGQLRRVGRYELFVDGVRIGQAPAGKQLSLDTTKFEDGFHELRVVAVESTPIETQGRWIAEVAFKNRTDSVQLTAVEGGRVTGGQIILGVASTIDGPTAVFHNHRELARVNGRQGRVQIPVAKVGVGPVAFQARTLGKEAVQSRPLRLEIL